MCNFEAKTIKLNPDNISDEHICCAFSDKKCSTGYANKKTWLKERFKDGYVFRKLDVRGKVFIEYVPIENAWVPVEAINCMMINCFWVSGKYKKHGFGTELFEHCLNDSTGMDGIIAVSSSKKQPFMSDRKFFKKKGFELVDNAKPYFELWFLPLKKNAKKPKFKSIAKNGKCATKSGLSVYYTDACPFNDYYVNVELKNIADKKQIPISINKMETKEQAQNHYIPHTLYSVFYNGEFVTQHILNENYFDKFFK